MRSGIKILLAATLIFCFTAVGCEKYQDEYDGKELAEYITVADYKHLKVSFELPEVTEEEIDSRISEMLESLSESVPAEDGIKAGDKVKYSAYCIVDGEAYPDLSEENRTLVFGEEREDSVIALIAPSLSGMKKGETVEVKITLPAGKIAGKSGDYGVVYRVTVLSVSRTAVPALTDETAEELMPGCGGVSGLRKKTEEKLTAAKRAEAEADAAAELWEKVLDGSTVISTPYGLFSEKYDELCDTYEYNAKSLDMSFNEYLEKYYGMNEGEFEDELNKKAAEMMRETLVVRYIADKEKIECTDEAAMNYASDCAAASAGDYASGEEYVDRYGIEAVEEQYLREKVIETLMQYAFCE